MTIALLYNRRLEGPDDFTFDNVLQDTGYRRGSACKQLYIEGKTGIGVIAANVRRIDHFEEPFPKRVLCRASILTVIDGVALPQATNECDDMEKRNDLFSMQWADNTLVVLEALLQCALLHGNVRSTRHSSQKKTCRHGTRYTPARNRGICGIVHSCKNAQKDAGRNMYSKDRGNHSSGRSLSFRTTKFSTHQY